MVGALCRPINHKMLFAPSLMTQQKQLMNNTFLFDLIIIIIIIIIITTTTTQHKSRATCPNSEFVFRFLYLLYRVIPLCKWRLTGFVFQNTTTRYFRNTYHHNNLEFLIRVICLYLKPDMVEYTRGTGPYP